MLRYIINRPIGVLTTFLGFIILGFAVLKILPVSLLPDIPIPQITVQISYPNTAARGLENTIVRPLRNQLLQVNNLKDITSTTRNNSATIVLDFEYKTNYNLAFIETNEKIDQIIGQLPRDLERPRVIKANASDIPVFYLSIVPKDSYLADQLELSSLARSVLKRRIEQLASVAFVDYTGVSETEIIIRPFSEKMESIKLTEEHIAKALSENNLNLGSILVKDGHYQYNISFLSELKTKEDIENIFIKVEGRVFQLKEIASIELSPQKRRGLYLHNEKEAIVFSIRKQADAQFFTLRNSFNELLESLKLDYPQLDFHVVNDQSEILEISISNLKSSLYYGAFFAFIMIFLFFRNWKVPFLIGIVIPIALVMSLVGFYLLDISVNVISLSGLILGVGLMIDNAIIVIENIHQHSSKGHLKANKYVVGANEIIRPLISSALTTCSVFLPLIFLSGIGGVLFYDQAISISIALGTSLIVAYFLLPVLLNVIETKNKPVPIDSKIKANNWFNRSVDLVLHFRRSILFLFLITLSLAIFTLRNIKKETFPNITRNAFLVEIDWNEPISLTESKTRVQEILKSIRDKYSQATTFIGEKQFLLDTKEQSMNEAEIIFYMAPEDLTSLKELKSKIKVQYPISTFRISYLENIFDKIFPSNQIPLIAHIQSASQLEAPSVNLVKPLLDSLNQKGITVQLTPQENQLFIKILKEKALLYNVPYPVIYKKLTTLFDQNNIGTIQLSNQLTPINLGTKEENISNLMQEALIQNEAGNYLQLKSFIEIQEQTKYKYIKAGKAGESLNIELEKYTPSLQHYIRQLITKHNNFSVHFSGQFFKTAKQIRELSIILSIAIVLLYLILAAQFESLIQPFIIILVVPIGIAGSIFLLFLTNQSLNLISIIGIIAMSGIVVNDAILKVDMMNKLLKKEGLKKAIHEAGRRRLRPIIMTSITTIFALLPILFSSGLGAELQRPLAFAIIGGLSIGTIASLYLIPVLYTFIHKR